ncbi:hypothetical protein Btru_035327 [Bulinus truncatus]|nr:hypothetical protein Btru_035327 [Bulinus truncatus]
MAPNQSLLTYMRLLAGLSLVALLFIFIEYSQTCSTFCLRFIDSGAVFRESAPSKPPTTAVNQAALMKVNSVWADLNVTSREVIFPPDIVGDYVFTNPDLCKGVDVIDFIIIVHTAPDHLEHRQRIRETFANESLFLPFHVRVAFLLGRPRNTTLERVLLEEHSGHNDTIMGEFMDDYHNLTLKGVMGFRWISENCGNAKVILKIDDDVIVNTYTLLYSFYRHISGKSRSIFCNHWGKNGMAILRSGKWKVPANHFPGRGAFPYDYCSGFAVIMTSDMAAPLYEAAKATPFFWIDDVYLYGMLPYVVGGVTYHQYSLSKHLTLWPAESMTCMKTKLVHCPILVSAVDSKRFPEFWKIIQDVYASGPWEVKRLLSFGNLSIPSSKVEACEGTKWARLFPSNMPIQEQSDRDEMAPNQRLQTYKRLLAGLSLVVLLFIFIEYSLTCSTLCLRFIDSGAVIREGAPSKPPKAAVDRAALMKVTRVWADLNVTSREVIFPPDIVGDYVFTNPDLCKGVDVIDFIIIVHTSTDHLEHRQRIRETFANESLFLPFHVRVAFLLGRPRNTTLERVLLEEHSGHNDTIMGDFVDDYHNLTLKGVMGFRWISENCGNAKFILKIDDDVIVNTYTLLYSFYRHISGKSRSIFCNHWSKNSMPIRRSGKWKVPANHFPGHANFPYDYCLGFALIMTSDMAAPLYEAAKATPFFWIDDVYLYGMLPYVVGGVTYHQYSLTHHLTLWPAESMTCMKTKRVHCPILVSLVNSKTFPEFWKIIQDVYASGPWEVNSTFIE